MNEQLYKTAEALAQYAGMKYFPAYYTPEYWENKIRACRTEEYRKTHANHCKEEPAPIAPLIEQGYIHLTSYNTAVWTQKAEKLYKQRAEMVRWNWQRLGIIAG